jgi:4a-hydroxytetrahydrobiopterin dehydratase
MVKEVRMSLTAQKCEPCESFTAAFSTDRINKYKPEVPEWTVIRDGDVFKLHRRFSFRTFIQSMGFVNMIAMKAEREGHHPVIHINFNKVDVYWWTHNINGLHKNDFIMAGKTSQTYEEALNA